MNLDRLAFAAAAVVAVLPVAIVLMLVADILAGRAWAP